MEFNDSGFGIWVWGSALGLMDSLTMNFSILQYHLFECWHSKGHAEFLPMKNTTS